jgi:hypothetical protein
MLARRLRQVADRCDDVQAAHSPRSDEHHGEGQERTEREGDDEARPAQVVADRHQTRLDQCSGQGVHHEQGQQQAECGADNCCDDVVRRPFEEEHLDQVAALGADRPGGAHLTPPLGREHDEDEKDQQDACRDRERAERREQGQIGGALGVGQLQAVALDLVDL